MPLTDAGRERIRQDLIGHKLIGKDDTLPTPPTVPDFDVIIPQRQFWLPIITDEALRDLI
jgi:hypothetical protein